ncbi:MAG: hypothetical protein A3K67_02445 [Euryarchaeota archaeon RBG_16_62_10]|nr:MAG: hypothetical protein A3K67_02445 [Euryarchaeota archaeon RBG_16_62_10]
MIRTMAGIAALTLFSAKKLLLGKKTIISILVALFVAAVMGYAGAQDVEPLEDGTNLLDTLILFFFMPVTAMIFGSSLIRDEIDDRSITHVATAPLDRAFTYVGYYLPLSIAVAVSMVAVSTVGFLAFFGQHRMGSEELEVYLEFLGLVVIGSFVYSSLFLAISVLFKKPVFFGLFYAFIWEGFVGSLPGAIQKASVKHYLRSIGSGWVEHGDISGFDQASSVWGSAVLLLVLMVFLLVFGAFLFREKELV